jgi:glutamyl-tRNA reductase
LRVGKRAHAETGIDQAPRSLVTAALDQAALAFTPPPSLQDQRNFPEDAPILDSRSRIFPDSAAILPSAGDESAATTPTAGARWLIVGAGAMGALARAELGRRGVTEIVTVNRSEREDARPLEELPELLKAADVIVTATASMHPVITLEMARAAAKPLTILDLAMPRDVEPGVGDLAHIRLIDIEHLTTVLPDHSAELGEVERIVASEVDAFGSWLRGGQVAPTVAALRARADEVMSTELKRVAQRLPELTQEQRDEVSHAIHRVVQRLLHQPTVRVRQLASEPGGEAYTQLLRDLFDLHPQSSTVAEVPEVSS